MNYKKQPGETLRNFMMFSDFAPFREKQEEHGWPENFDHLEDQMKERWAQCENKLNEAIEEERERIAIMVEQFFFSEHFYKYSDDNTPKELCERIAYFIRKKNQ